MKDIPLFINTTLESQYKTTVTPEMNSRKLWGLVPPPKTTSKLEKKQTESTISKLWNLTGHSKQPWAFAKGTQAARRIPCGNQLTLPIPQSPVLHSWSSWLMLEQATGNPDIKKLGVIYFDKSGRSKTDKMQTLPFLPLQAAGASHNIYWKI